MGGVKTIDMRTHGTQKTKTKVMCSHKTKHKQVASKTESLAMCKMGHEHAANKETHKPRVHTNHDKHESQTKQDKRRQRMHTDRGVHGPSELETARSHSKIKPGA